MFVWLSDILSMLVGVVGQWGYLGVLLLMFLESSFFPVPGEVAMVPAGYLSSPAYRLSEAYVPGQEMNFWIAILMGVLGSLLGSLVNYYLAYFLGRRLLVRFGHYIFVTEPRLQRLEKFFRTHGEIATFTGRLIPAVRQHIGMPAGLVRMHLGRFLLLTSMGAGVWITAMTYVGYLAGQNEELLAEYSKEMSLAVGGGCLLIMLVYVAIYMIGRRARQTQILEGEKL